MPLMKTTEMSIVIIVSVLLIGNLVFSSNNYKAVGITDNRTNGNNNTPKTITTSLASTKCNTSLWNFIANPPGRFKILNQCVTVTGKVLSVQYEPDGDTDFPLALDSPYKNMVTKANFNPLMKGGIWSEMICQHPEQSSSTEAFKRGECNGYSGPIFTVPRVGQHLQVTGTYLLDVREGGHAEIHPVSSIKLIK
jgi:hypothetical protein